LKRFDPPAHAGRRALLIAPHQDDEALGCGGTLHLLASAGAHVHVVVVARGDGGVDGGAGMEQREEESRRCCERLGTRPPVFLRVPSAELREDPLGAGRRLREAVGAERPELLFVPSPLERHDTHRATLLAALCADVGAPDAAWWGWGVWDPIPAVEEAAEVDITEARSAKTLAIAAHASQNRARALAAGMAARDMEQAVFARITGDEPRKAVERLLDLSALGRQRPAPATAAEAAARCAAWLRHHAEQRVRALWP
jgi:LmbE family N-acetylglucosaminyl deacetylase